MKKIGIIFGMETTFPPALVEKINAMGVPGVHAELASDRRSTHGRALALPRDHRPHLA